MRGFEKIQARLRFIQERLTHQASFIHCYYSESRETRASFDTSYEGCKRLRQKSQAAMFRTALRSNRMKLLR